MTPEEITNAQSFLSTRVLTKEHQEIIAEVLYSDKQAKKLAEELQHRDQRFKNKIEEAAGITTAKIANYLFYKLKLEYIDEHESERIYNPYKSFLKSDDTCIPKEWKSSIKAEGASFTLEDAFPIRMQGKIDFGDINEVERISDSIKIIRANADFAINGQPNLERELLGLTAEERVRYDDWRAGFLQCSLER